MICGLYKYSVTHQHKKIIMVHNFVPSLSILECPQSAIYSYLVLGLSVVAYSLASEVASNVIFEIYD